MNVLNYSNEDNLQEIVNILKNGELVVYPTDTIYGIGADINNNQAIKKIFHVKKRSLDKAISISFHDFNQLENYVETSDKIQYILEKSLPGPYTFLLKKKNNVNPLLTANSPIVGIRIPDNIIAHHLTKYFPITSTSANISNNPTPNNIHDIMSQLENNIHTYINYGRLGNTKPSTIIDLTKDKPKIVRKGLANEKLLDKILKVNL